MPTNQVATNERVAGAAQDERAADTNHGEIGGMGMKKSYLGDGVYLSLPEDHPGFWLTTEDGIQTTNRIFMEPEVFAALLQSLKATEQSGDGGHR